ncbi:MAG: tRNA (adenosine(37)-N6)-dimethylallyltransferase MiaA [Bacteroidota bacterium]
MPSNPKILAIVGPTGSGKTPLSLRLAEHLGGEVVSADSRQIYKFLDIGTAKPTKEDLARVKHHFVSMLDPKQDFSAGEYGRLARETINELLAKKRLPILVGGSGLYVKAVVDGFFDGPGRDSELRAKLEERLERDGKESLYKTLCEVDPASAATMDASKPRRVLRALEIFYITGKPISRWHQDQQTEPPFAVQQYALDWERKELYNRIDNRVGEMIAHGLIEEVKNLSKQGYGRELNALNTVGYVEVFDYLDGKFSLNEMTDLIKRNTRRFAKRQMTWFRADKRIRWIPVNGSEDFEGVAKRIAANFLARDKKPA